LKCFSTSCKFFMSIISWFVA